MTWRVSIRDAPHVDLREARDWYERQRPGLGDDFLLSIADAMSALEQSPERFPLYYRGFRRLIVHRFPYKVFFRIEGDEVILFRVLHAARDHSGELE